MIIEQGFERLYTGFGTDRVDTGELLEQSRVISRNWKSDIVKNEEKTNFSLDSDLRFHYLTEAGKEKETDITQFAFSQLCSRMGVPAHYIQKCFKSGKEELALENFHAWAGDVDKNMLVRENNGVVRAVLSDSYRVFDSSSILKALKYTVDESRWVPTQAFLSEDQLMLRYVDFDPLPVNDGSPLYLGFNVSSSDVGRGALNIKMMIYRSVCRNGLLISNMGGTLFTQRHIGEAMSEGKIQAFGKALTDLDIAGKAVVENISACRNRSLDIHELRLYLDRAKRELKLSEKSMEKLDGFVAQYGPTKWGIINGLTELAQDFTLTTRTDIETWAGDFFAKAA